MEIDRLVSRLEWDRDASWCYKYLPFSEGGGRGAGKRVAKTLGWRVSEFPVRGIINFGLTCIDCNLSNETDGIIYW